MLRHVIGYRRNGQPVFAIAGGSGEDNPQQPQHIDPASGFPEAVVEVPVVAERPRDPNTGQFISEEEAIARIERARSEERDKLYARLKPAEEFESKISTMAEELAALRAEREARAEAEAEAAAQASAEQEAREREELDAKSLLGKVEQEFQTKFEQMQAELAQRDAMLEQERRLSQLESYRTARLTQEQSGIAPQFHDYVMGNTEEEIDASIERAKAKTAEILNEMAALQQQQSFDADQARRAAPGTRPTAPPVGPMEAVAGTRTFTAEEIKAMSPAEYAQHREALKAAARRQSIYG